MVKSMGYRWDNKVDIILLIVGNIKLKFGEELRGVEREEMKKGFQYGFWLNFVQVGGKL